MELSEDVWSAKRIEDIHHEYSRKTIASETMICLKPVNDLLGESFFVSSYQRGYRWTTRQVEDLLNDIWEFQSKSDLGSKSAFYCLQPIVVKKRLKDEWELVDGQQRLTTIFLLLTYLKPILELLGKSRFTLEFETRSETSGAFLHNIDVSQRDDNIDYFHICNAYEAIENWFKKRDGNHKIQFLSCLLNDDEVGKNVKIIWYELPELEDSVQAFTRLNVGKIPLTNAELIRALFLRAGNFDPGAMTLLQLKIAQEWDVIESRLQSNDVWYFLHSGSNIPSSRIEYIFQLIAREEQSTLSDDPYHTFHFYNKKFNEDGMKVEQEWLRVKQYFMALEEWFEDRTLYHLIGYLIYDNEDLLALRKSGHTSSKNAFQATLKQKICKKMFAISIDQIANVEELKQIISIAINELDYEKDVGKIRSVLLLFNIATLLRNSNSNLRFPFNIFKLGKWDIEHVRSVESGKPTRSETQKRWLENASKYLHATNEVGNLYEEIQDQLRERQIEKDQFDTLYHNVLAHFHEEHGTETDNGIGNLALLDETTNRSYKNAVFPMKRRKILDLDRSGTFVPLCTRNVFLKCYSQNVTNMMFWTAEDATDYRDAIILALVEFFQTKDEIKS